MTMGWGLSAPKADAADADCTIYTADQLRALANNPGDYAGKTVKLGNSIDLSGSNFTPIGTKSSPFTGTFDGDGHTISGLTVSGDSYLGLFGYVGAGGKIENVTITNGDDNGSPSTITATSSSKVIHCVGSIAGYVYGTAGTDDPAIENCSSSAKVTVTSTMQPSSSKSAEFTPEGTPTSGSSSESLDSGYSDNGTTIEYIGGVVGYCAGSIEDTSYSGTLSATTHESPQSEDETTMGTSVGGVAGQVGGFDCNQTISGSDDILLKAQYPSGDGAYKTDTDSPSHVSNCSNTGSLTVVADANGGLDRFGVTVSTTFNKVGGIVGGSMADVTSCTNSCDINAETSTAVGGVVGSLRGNTYTGTSLVAYDSGEQFTTSVSGSTVTYTSVSTGPTLKVKRCTTKSSVTGRAQVGGVVGVTGTHTKISFCQTLLNGSSSQMIQGTRWNKPTVGGIVGACHGDIAYCYNHVDCKTTTGGGYFVAGIAGSLARYTTDASGAKDSPVPNMNACYFTGIVRASGSYRQGGLVGENSGYVRNSYCIKDHVLSVAAADSVNPYRPMIGENLGTVADSVKEVDADYMKTKQFCADLNANTELDQYQNEDMEYFLPDASGDDAANDGYPVFAYERSDKTTGLYELNNDGLTQTNAGSATATYRADANPVPDIDVSYNGTTLVQGADYYVIPDSDVLDSNGKTRDVKDMSDETFTAHIVGIGDYYTSDTTNGSTFGASYTVVKGDFSTCSISIEPATFNYLAQYPSKDTDITVTDAAGSTVPTDAYSIPADPGTYVNYHVTYASQSHDGQYHVGYEIAATANDDSNYTGTIYGYFQIKKASLLTDEKTHFSGFSFAGKTWKWSGGHVTNGKATGGYLYTTNSSGKQVKGMTIVYTGEQIRPKALTLQYEDGNGKLHTLKNGSDYRVVYGDPGRDDLISTDNNSITNVASADGDVGTRPCVTIRYVPGDSHNFTNYQNFFFTITKASLSKKSQTKVTIPSTIVWKDKSRIKVKGYTGATISSSNYKVKFGKIKKNGKAKVTLTGKKNLKGKYSKTVKVVKAYTVGKGRYIITSKKKRTAKLYSIKAKATSFSIPSKVKIKGKKYRVTAVDSSAATQNKKLKKLKVGSNVTQIGKNAFSGSKKLSTVTLGVGVKKIGSKAFYNCSKLKKIVVKTKKLGKKSIGKKAFSKIAKRPVVDVPSGKKSLYKKAFKHGGITKKARYR